MKKFLSCLVLAFFMATTLLFADNSAPSAALTTPAASSSTDATKPAEQASKPPRVEVRSIESGNYFTHSADRLGHGMGNIAFSLLEWPYQVGRDLEHTNPVSALFAGTVKGVVFTVLRAAAGAVEVVTFFLPMKPLIRDFDTGWFNI